MYTRTYILIALFIFVTTGCGKADQGSETFSERYIVVLKENEIQAASNRLMTKVGADVIKSMAVELSDDYGLEGADRVFSVVIKGAAFRMDEARAEELRRDPRVKYVEKDHVISVNAVQADPPWGLDRVDQLNLPLSQSYAYSTGGAVVNAYVIDTGIRIDHVDFGGRASHGADFVDDDSDASDCNGHGTHVAGTIGGTTYGVAKNVKLHGVRVLNCAGAGQYSGVIAGIEWVTQNHVKPAVANLSLGGPVSQAVDDAIRAAVAAGVTVVVAAGNSNRPACEASPARVPDAVTVGSTTNGDVRSNFSNYGTCVDVFAPGSDIKSAWYRSNTATETISGTSMASPHVAGVAALYLAKNPQATPSQVTSALLAGATPNKISSPGTGSPNLLLNTAFLGPVDDGGGGGDGGGEPDVPGGDVPLVNNVSLGNQSGAAASEKFYVIDVAAGSATLTVEISGGSGDADLYVKHGARPALLTYDCRPYLTGNVERCSINAPAAGKWHVMLKGYASYSGVSLKASFGGSADPAPCTGCEHYVGQLSGRGASATHPNGTYYYSGSGKHEYWLRGPANADFDIYLYKLSGSRWVQVARSAKTKSVEEIHYNGSAGYYTFNVVSYSGGGKYDLWRKAPN